MVSADGIANIKCSPLLYYFAFNKKRLPFNLGLEEIQLKVNKSFEKIHDFAKQEVAEEYKQWQDIFKLYC